MVESTYEVVFYRTSRGDSPVDEFLDALDTKARAKVEKWLTLLEEEGPVLPRPYADVVEGSIRELRVSIGRLEVRLLFFFHEKTIVVTHGFLKKTRAIQSGEVQRALRVRADWLQRYGG